jgi:hypothetical protein
LTQLGLISFCKTRGGKGLHVVTPLRWPRKGEKLDWPTPKGFANNVCIAIASDSPDRLLVNMAKAKRKGKVFLDHLRNDRFSTAVSPPLSPRSRPRARDFDAPDVDTGSLEPRSNEIYREIGPIVPKEIMGMGGLLRKRAASA